MLAAVLVRHLDELVVVRLLRTFLNSAFLRCTLLLLGREPLRNRDGWLEGCFNEHELEFLSKWETKLEHALEHEREQLLGLALDHWIIILGGLAHCLNEGLPVLNNQSTELIRGWYFPEAIFDRLHRKANELPQPIGVGWLLFKGNHGFLGLCEEVLE